MRKTNKDIELQIIDEYNNGLSCKKIGEKLKMNTTTIFNILKRNNITLRTKGGIEKLPINKIKNMYINDHQTLKQISEHFNVTIETIRSLILKENIKIRNMSEHHNPNLNHDYFENINNEYKAYFLGFLITDGNIGKTDLKNGKPTKSIKFSLKKEDKYILEIFKSQLGEENLCLYDDKRGCSTLTVYSKKLTNDLKKYGVVTNKTWKTFLPSLDEGLMKHLIRGLIDGDGWITYHITSKGKNGYGLGLCGNKDLVIDVKNYLCNKLNVYNIKPNIRNKLYSIKWGSKKDILTICNYLYNESNVYLYRKYKVYQKILNL